MGEWIVPLALLGFVRREHPHFMVAGDGSCGKAHQLPFDIRDEERTTAWFLQEVGGHDARCLACPDGGDGDHIRFLLFLGKGNHSTMRGTKYQAGFRGSLLRLWERRGS